MIKSADVVMPCLKYKNQITAKSTENAFNLLHQSKLDQPFKTTLQSALGLNGEFGGEQLLPNFTC